MPDVQQLLIFMAAGVLLNLTPGPDVLFIVSHSLRAGVRPGLVAALGITAGCFFHLGGLPWVWAVCWPHRRLHSI